jgi:tyrosinase
LWIEWGEHMALRTRKNQADLTDDERSGFVAAVKKMKQSGAYDKYISIHQNSMAGMNMWAHRRPGFLPWHRQFILDFEKDLLAADAGATSGLALPYWDWINYHARKHFLWWGNIWRDDFMGGDGDSGNKDRVTDKPFKDWVMYYDPNLPQPVGTETFLQRQLGRDTANLPSGSLPSQEHWDAASAITVYDSADWMEDVGNDPVTHLPAQPKFQGVPSFRNVFEGFVSYDPAKPEPELHNKIHVWVGGTMGPMTSPNDPIFYLHHCNVDRLWAQWQSANPAVPYLPDRSMPALTGPDGHNLPDAMPPWDGIARPAPLGTSPTVHIKDVLNHQLLGYRYDTDPAPINAKAKP